MSTVQPFSPVASTLWPKSKDSKGRPQIGPKFVNKVMPWVESYWHEFKRYPSPGDFIDRWGLSYQQYDLLSQSKFWNDCLNRRGIRRPQRPTEELSERQVAAIALLTNFGDGRSEEAKLAAIRVTPEEIQGWYSDPEFKRQLALRAEDVFHNVAPEATVALAKQIKRGNFQAIKFYMEITGQATTPEIHNLKQTMQILVEAVQKHVKDPSTLAAIAAEMNSVREIRGL